MSCCQKMLPRRDRRIETGIFSTVDELIATWRRQTVRFSDALVLTICWILQDNLQRYMRRVQGKPQDLVPLSDGDDARTIGRIVDD